MTHQDISPSVLLPTDLTKAEDAARILGVAKNTVYHWARMGYLPHYRIGRLMRVSMKDLANFLERERRG